MFGSKTVLAHILRGMIGFGALGLAIVLARNADTASVHASVTLAIVALIALRGCPVCWTIGLLETLRGKTPHPFRERDTDDTSRDIPPKRSASNIRSIDHCKDGARHDDHTGSAGFRNPYRRPIRGRDSNDRSEAELLPEREWRSTATVDQS